MCLLIFLVTTCPFLGALFPNFPYYEYSNLLGIVSKTSCFETKIDILLEIYLLNKDAAALNLERKALK